jgi:hypothetical protein
VKKIKKPFCYLIFMMSLLLSAQRVDLNGQLVAGDEVEGLHIRNKTASKYTISNSNGGFVIGAKVSDTVYISGLKYEVQEFIITQFMIESGRFTVQLVEKINQLSEVVVGKMLTGSLESDIENSDAKPKINFYDLGIDASTNIPPTQSERRLYDADHGKFVYFGLGLVINVHKILNRINGDTNEYKERIEIEFKEKCINTLKSEYSETIFQALTIPYKNKEEFFQFCFEDKQFKSVCEDKKKLNAVGFLLDKLKIFKTNLNEDD